MIANSSMMFIFLKLKEIEANGWYRTTAIWRIYPAIFSPRVLRGGGDYGKPGPGVSYHERGWCNECYDVHCSEIDQKRVEEVHYETNL